MERGVWHIYLLANAGFLDALLWQEPEMDVWEVRPLKTNQPQKPKKHEYS